MSDPKRILVTGATGFLGQHVVARLMLRGGGGTVVTTGDREDADLRSLNQVRDCVRFWHPDVIVHLAYPGSQRGILTSVETPYTLASDLIQMDQNVIRAAIDYRVEKLVCLGSTCSYPAVTQLPTREDELWDGYPEQVNAAYGIAKRTQLMLLQAARQEHGLNGIHLILANLYGPGDRTSHVIPATIAKVRRVLQAQEAPEDGVVVWGEPDTTRSFLYVADAAEAILRAMDVYSEPEPLNVGTRQEVSMRTLVGLVSRQLGYDGPITYDRTKPTGHRRRFLNVDRLEYALGWYPVTPFADGLASTIQWSLEHVAIDQESLA